MGNIQKDLYFAQTYLEDVFILFMLIEGHLEHLYLFFDSLTGNRPLLGAEKCFFGQESVELLGHIVLRMVLGLTRRRSGPSVCDVPVAMEFSAMWSFLGLPATITAL